MGERFTVTGGTRLVGRLAVSGAKNSALKLMAAALLTRGTTTLSNVPAIQDVRIMAELVRRLGADVDYDEESGIVSVTVPDVIGHRADYELVRALRASISVLGPLVARCGEAEVAIPGGDAIGSRGLDMHISGLAAMGATVRVEHGYLVATAPNGLRGAEVHLDFPSVGATETILMAAVTARGRTVLDNAAREPEIVDIAAMLTAMGADVEGAGSSTIVIGGGAELRPVAHTVIPDRIAAGTWAYAAAISGGDIEIVGGMPGHLRAALAVLEDAGCVLEPTPGGFRVAGPARPTAVNIATMPYPGFPTDLQPFALVLNAIAQGSAMITENLFEARFRVVQELARLGADARVDGHHVMMYGVARLSGAPVEAGDIRAGAALVLAGLVADGTTVVHGIQHIDRGYPRFEESLRALGAQIERGPGLPELG